MSKLYIILSGIIMGIANIIPGISGGTILVLLCIYDKTLNSIKNLKNKEDRFESLSFLSLLIIGVLIGLLGGAIVVKAMLDYNYSQSLIFFSTLIVLSIPKFYKDTFTQTNNFNRKYFFISFLTLTTLTILALNFDKTITLDTIPELELKLLIFLSISGIIAGFAMIFPGISGSMIQLLIGTYVYFTTFISMITSMDLTIFIYLSFIGSSMFIGVILGVVTSSYLVEKHKLKTYSVIFGLILASCFGLFIEAFHLEDVDNRFIIFTISNIIVTTIVYKLIIFSIKKTNNSVIQ